MLHYNFTYHIWPRCETLRDMGMKNFDLVETLSGTDEEFCKKFRVDKSALEARRKKKPQRDEKEKFWKFSMDNDRTQND
mgnify:FL=1